MEKLKSLVPWILGAVSLLAGGDMAVGLLNGKSILNVSMIPSLLAAGGAGGTLLARWLNSRFISARVIKPSLNDDFRDEVEALFAVAADLDVPEDMVESLASIAGAKVKAYRAKAKVSEVKP